jgi:Tol biopolymer transport system component/predicted Ser/Thr protein kinase
MSGPTDPLLWKRAREAFDAVVDLPVSQRQARLAVLCDGDPALHAEVESLLVHADAPHEVLSAILEQAAQSVFDCSTWQIGQTILHYQVTGELGQGGMGVVWKATDRTLGREVAIKVLPSAVSRDPVRLARLDREAKLLASLNHPNVASIYSLHESDGTRFLTMEYVEGNDLAARLARGPLPVPDVLSIARQVADGLEEAHEKGIVHRDLKPANVKITSAGKVKVLDFGLAKAVGRDVGATEADTPIDAADVSTLTTRAGLVLGTAAYMAPEQARGLPVDRRADIWSFGVLLFEMLTGHRPFDGATITDVLSAVVSREPDWTTLPPATPARLERLIQRCLAKDPHQRLRDIGEARVALEDLIGGRDDTFDARPPRRSGRRDAVMAVLGATAAAGLAAWLLWPAPAIDPGNQRFNVALPPGLRIEDALDANRQTMALSRDGRQLAFTTRDAVRRKQIYIRRMDQVDAAPVPGTEGADMPFFSPDGLQLGFASEGKLKRVSLPGGAPVVIGDAPEARGASWSDDGTIVFAPGAFAGLVRVAATGGTPTPVTTVNRPGEEGHRWPVILPGGRAVIFATVPAGRRDEDATIDLVRLDSGDRRTLVRGGLYPRYVDRHLLYASDGRIVAAPFDLSALATTGPAVAVLNDVRIDLRPDPRVLLDVSTSGALAYVSGSPSVAERELVWLDRHGVSTAVVNEKRPYRGAQLSPDGRSLAVLIDSPPVTSLWTYSLERRTWNRLTFDQDVSTPAWTPDSARLVYSADGLRRTYIVAADGGQTPVRLMPQSDTAGDMPAIAPNGRLALIAIQNSGGDDIISLTLDGKDVVAPFQADAGNEASPAFSPDGTYVAYSSTTTGRREVYIRTFAHPVRKWPVSVDGGITPRWSRNGRELFFLAGARVMSVPVTATSAGLTVGTPGTLFEEPALTWNGTDAHRYDVSADGQRFLAIRPDPREVRPLQIVVIPQFVAELRNRLAGR